jgi:hypothetical protein
MEQLADIISVPLFRGTISTDKDEWRGKSDARERKKIQSRINQRARRKITPRLRFSVIAKLQGYRVTPTQAV